MANALIEVQNTFITLDRQYSLLRAACQTEQDREALAAKYAAAQSAYYACVNKMLSDDDAAVAALCTQLKTANKVVAQATEQMGDMSKVLDNITKALDLGSSLISFL